MAKPIEYVIELNKEQAQTFIDQIGKPNPARDETVKRAEKLNVKIR